MDKQTLKNLIANLFAGKATEQEKQLLNKWYNNFDSENVIIPSESLHQKKETEDRILQNILAKIDTSSKPIVKKHILWYSNQFIRAAATILLFLSIGFGYFYFSNLPKSSGPYFSQTFSNPNGKRSVNKLSDGSVVYLNAGSKISYKENSKFREVYLEGEAFFDVAPNKNIPFLVHCKKMDIKVVGTAFNVKSFENNEDNTVTVEHGHVMVAVNNIKKNEYNYSLKASQQITYKASLNMVQLGNVDHLEIGAWRENRLQFKDIKLKEVFAVMERHYGVNIKIENDEVYDCQVTATLNNIGINEALDQLSKIFSFSYKINENNIYLTGGSCSKK